MTCYHIMEMPQTINLKKGNVSAEEESENLGGEIIAEWSFYEPSPTRWNSNAILIPGALAFLFVVFAIFIKSYFFAVFVLLAFGIFTGYIRKSPKNTRFMLTENGFSVGGQTVKMEEIKSFWIFDRGGYFELSFHTSKTLFPFIKIPMVNTEPDHLRLLLRRLVKEEEHKDQVIDHLARRIGF